jgi:hypothetical protein
MGSFRTREGLDDAREQATLHLKATLARMDEPALREAQQQARERGAMDVLDRVSKAVKVVEGLRQKRSNCSNKKRQSTEPKASTTDPDARIMKVSNGGFEPSYNVQLAVVGSPLGGPATVVGVQVTSLGSDKGSILPMCAQVEQRTGHKLTRSGRRRASDPRRTCAAPAQQLTVIAPVPRGGQSEAPQTRRSWVDRPDEDGWHVVRIAPEPGRRVNAISKGRIGLRRSRAWGPKVLRFLLAAVVVNLMARPRC